MIKITKYMYLELVTSSKQKANIKTYISFDNKIQSGLYETSTDVLEDEVGSFIIVYNKKYYLKEFV